MLTGRHGDREHADSCSAEAAEHGTLWLARARQD